MNKVVLTSLLSLSLAAPAVNMCVAQAAPQQNPPAGGQVQMSEQEFTAYNNAKTQATPAAKAAAFEAYLKAYPNSAVKADVLEQMMYAYSQANDQPNTLSAADRVLAVTPNDLRALVFEVYLRRPQADALTDPAAKTAALDKIATYAQTGLAAPKPTGMSDADWKTAQTQALPIFRSAIADDQMSKKDYAGAIQTYKDEISSVPEQTQTPGPVLQDVVFLANAYMSQGDFLNCAWYATRAAAYAGQFANQIQPLATYCYKKYHGDATGYDALQAQVKTTLTPPADLGTTVKPAPKPEDYVAQTIATTPDLAVLALSDKEFILQYGKPEDAEKVFATIKGKSVEIPNALVIQGSTEAQLLLAVSDDAQQSKTADFTFNMKTPLPKAPTVGEKVTVQGTYDSYTQKPVMIVMSDGELVVKKAAAPAHHTTSTHHAPARKR